MSESKLTWGQFLGALEAAGTANILWTTQEPSKVLAALSLAVPREKWLSFIQLMPFRLIIQTKAPGWCDGGVVRAVEIVGAEPESGELLTNTVFLKEKGGLGYMGHSFLLEEIERRKA